MGGIDSVCRDRSFTTAPPCENRHLTTAEAVTLLPAGVTDGSCTRGVPRLVGRSRPLAEG
jgi:hypothetical protein